MKKVIGILFLTVILIATTVLAAYPEDLENAELEQTQEENITTLTNEQLENAESLIEEPATEELDILEITENDRLIDEYNHEGVITSDLYQFDKEITLNTIVDGNVYVMAESVKFDHAVIYGNAYIIGQNIELKNVDIQGSLYVCGQNIEISGKINDIYACGAEINFSEDAYVKRDVKLAGESLKIDGTIQRDAFIGVNNLIINGNTVINGTLNYASQNEVSIPEHAQIANVNFEKIEIEEDVDNVGTSFTDYIAKLIKIVVTTAILSLIIVSFVNKFSKMNRTEKVANDLLKNAGIGALVLILTPILTIILSASNIFRPIGISGLLIYIVGLILATSMTSIEIAKRIVAKKQNELGKWKKVGIASLVALVYGIVGFIPVVGTICKIAFLLIGLGIIFNLLFKNNKIVEK